VTAPFGNAEKAIAKAMVIHHGTATRAHEALDALWVNVPSERALQRWRADTHIEVDYEYLEALRKEVIESVPRTVARIIEPLEERLITEIATGSANDVFNLTKAMGVLIDKVNPITPGRYGAQQTYNDNRTLNTFTKEPTFTIAPQEVVESE
jgi:hypothetical protein